MFPRFLIRRTLPHLRLSAAVAAHSKQYSIALNRNVLFAANSKFSHSFYSSHPNHEDLTVDYDYVKKATSNNSILIVDVREPDEVKEHGKIPNSINIPLGDLTTVLSTMPEKEFEQTFKRPKPSEEMQVIFYCMIGKRSGMAQQNAFNIGYKNAKNYLGSWTDWATKTQS